MNTNISLWKQGDLEATASKNNRDPTQHSIIEEESNDDEFMRESFAADSGSQEYFLMLNQKTKD